ncbi:MAG: acetylxylan esterase [Saprospiraceae bacterium]|nr:acetylxylan esterase [Saprospiraceae bacterium]
MKFKVLMLTAILNFFYSFFGVETLDAQPIDISVGDWKFKAGDDLAWATPQYKDEDWQPIEVGKPWEVVKAGYDGFGWYRKTIVLDSRAMRKAVKSKGSLVIRLGKIDDADETYFNGVKIGATGKMPPHAETAWDADRVYFIPKNLINWKKRNTIAVRVHDSGGGGGMYAGEYQLEPLSWKQRFDIKIENSEASNAFAEGKPVGINVKLKNDSDDNLSGRLTVLVKTFTGEEIEEQKTNVEIKKGQTTHVPTLTFDINEVGFYIAHATFEDRKGNKLSQKCGFAYEPTQAISAPTPPEDFKKYWEEAREQLDAVAPNFILTPTPQYATAKTDVYEVEMRSLGNVRIRGYYTQPKGKKNLAAMLHVQGYSSIMAPFDIDNPNFAQFFLNIRGHGNSRDDINPGFPGYLLSGITEPEKYIYRGAFMDCVRAVDFLVSRPEIDANRLVVEGGSQGGALSIATAALDSRIKFCMPDMPFLSDFRQYFDIARWPADEFKLFSVSRLRKMETIFRTLDYIDIKNLAPSVNCPVFMGVGLFDDVCPPAINFAAFNNLSSTDKSFNLYPQNGHNMPAKHYNAKLKWLYKRMGL